MKVVTLPRKVRDDIVAHAREEAPRECCGLLIGRDWIIDESVRAPNLHASASRFLLDPAVHVQTSRRLRGTGRDVVGAYHSHPLSPAVPSETDREEALYPEFVWIIVSLLAPDGDVAAFKLTTRAAEALPLVLES